MIEAFQYEFMQNALAAGILACVACGIIGSLVVVNRLVFLAGGIAHCAYGGIGLAFYAGLPVLPTTLGFSVIASTIMAGVTHRQEERSDTVIGAMWAAGMALGVILLDLTPGYNVDLMSYLFGSILTVSHEDLLFIALVDVLAIILTWIFYRDFLSVSFDREFSRSKGVPVDLLHYLLPALTALTVVMIIRMVGLILVIALLTIPPYLAERRSRSLIGMMVLSSLLGMFFCVSGLLLSYAFNLTSGASIIAIGAVCFFVDRGIDVLKNTRLHFRS
ncbi:metal ABC transporter permease [Desulfovibrio inopinatus]|uniref:metal ABC transporter permease n=1 Tax=Desulfovibrio inopinatus TaxID=102109 RepID=UPI0004033FA3|nr:metal ABC transporter permease [Desulfovibrio inopinatus]